MAERILQLCSQTRKIRQQWVRNWPWTISGCRSSSLSGEKLIMGQGSAVQVQWNRFHSHSFPRLSGLVAYNRTYCENDLILQTVTHWLIQHWSLIGVMIPRHCHAVRRTYSKMNIACHLPVLLLLQFHLNLSQSCFELRRLKPWHDERESV